LGATVSGRSGSTHRVQPVTRKHNEINMKKVLMTPDE
jgi:hypothetical protein